MRKTAQIGAVLSAALVLAITGCGPKPEPAKEAAKEPVKEAPAAPPPGEAGKEEAKAPEAPKPDAKKEEPAKKDAAKPFDPGKAEVFKVRFDTTKGPFVMEIHRPWAPKGAQRFYELIQDKYFDNSAFFRVVPNFVVQFGLAADPAKTRKWDKNIDDDPVARTNKTGAVVYATMGPNTRTTQLFINLKTNQFLDSQGFAPFGEVVEGMDVVQKLTAKYGEQPEQPMIKNRGNAYIKANFPDIDMIKTARFVE